MKPCSECTGKLISQKEIKTYFSSLASIRKKDATQQGLNTHNNEALHQTNPRNALMLLRLDTLKQRCRQLGIKFSGKKALLVERIIAAET